MPEALFGLDWRSSSGMRVKAEGFLAATKEKCCVYTKHIRAVGNDHFYDTTKRASQRLTPPLYRGDSLVSQKWG